MGFFFQVEVTMDSWFFFFFYFWHVVKNKMFYSVLSIQYDGYFT